MHQVAKNAAEKLLEDRVRFVDAKTSGTLNESTFKVDLGADVAIWEGPALFVTAARSRTTDDAGGDTQVDQVELRVPMDAPAVVPGTVAICTASKDADLVGESFQIVRSATRTSSILRRFTLFRHTPHSSVSAV